MVPCTPAVPSPSLSRLLICSALIQTPPKHVVSRGSVGPAPTHPPQILSVMFYRCRAQITCPAGGVLDKHVCTTCLSKYMPVTVGWSLGGVSFREERWCWRCSEHSRIPFKEVGHVHSGWTQCTWVYYTMSVSKYSSKYSRVSQVLWASQPHRQGSGQSLRQNFTKCHKANEYQMLVEFEYVQINCNHYILTDEDKYPKMTNVQWQLNRKK